MISAIGQAAGVQVNVDPRSGKMNYASAHDLRRSFGERWAARVMPQLLMQLMRREPIETTMRFDVGRNAQAAADQLWAAYDATQRASNNSGKSDGAPVDSVDAASECNSFHSNP